MKQADITPGVYESRDGMVREVRDIIRKGESRVLLVPGQSAVQEMTATEHVVRYRHPGSHNEQETTLKNFAGWAARRKDPKETNVRACLLHDDCEAHERAILDGVHHVAAVAVCTPAVREAEANAVCWAGLDEMRADLQRMIDLVNAYNSDDDVLELAAELATKYGLRNEAPDVPLPRGGELVDNSLGVWQVSCGQPGCEAEDGVFESSASRAPRELRAVGWTISRKRGVGWVCPKHSVRSAAPVMATESWEVECAVPECEASSERDTDALRKAGWIKRPGAGWLCAKHGAEVSVR